ncbi:MAG: dTMP kinase [bacterium]|nr:dTMP kinase [bacterium]
MMIKNGTFITFEGIEGSGKSTQIEMLGSYLKDKNIPFITTKEPGGTVLGLKIRELLLDRETEFFHHYSELLLFYVDRLENVAGQVIPALEQGKIVLCDRYIDSSFAYQMGARQVPEELLSSLNKLVNLMPDITILYDIMPETGLDRAQKRSEKDRFETEDLGFHNKVRDAYLKQAGKDPARIKVIPVLDMCPDKVFQQTRYLLEDKISAYL